MTAPYQSINREAIWAALYNALRAQLTAAPWAPSTAYALGAKIADPQGHIQTVTVAGTSGTTPPAWNDAGGTTQDGATSPVTWKDSGAGFVSIGRKHKSPPDLGMAEMPALFVVQIKETHAPQKHPGYPSRLTLHGFLILYAQAPIADEDIGTETVLAATMLNALYERIEDVMQPDNIGTGKFTLGGLVEHCWIEGDTDQDPGILGPLAAAILPVHILVP